MARTSDHQRAPPATRSPPPKKTQAVTDHEESEKEQNSESLLEQTLQRIRNNFPSLVSNIEPTMTKEGETQNVVVVGRKIKSYEGGTGLIDTIRVVSNRG
jgi:hypothetical protein